MRKVATKFLQLYLAQFSGDIPVILDAQLASDYVNSLGHTPIKVSSFPCIRPPWDTVIIVACDRGVPLVWAAQITPDARAVDFACSMLQPGEGVKHIARARLDIDADGSPTGTGMDRWIGDNPPELMKGWRPLSVFMIAFEALAMCHVKGSVIESDRPLRRPGQSLTVRPKMSVYSYRTLRIEAMERFVSSVKAGNASGKRMHLVRGHYKDFRNGPGVGGNAKAKGIYWTPAHIRGEKALGMVAKDYEIGAVE